MSSQPGLAARECKPRAGHVNEMIYTLAKPPKPARPRRKRRPGRTLLAAGLVLFAAVETAGVLAPQRAPVVHVQSAAHHVPAGQAAASHRHVAAHKAHHVLRSLYMVHRLLRVHRVFYVRRHYVLRRLFR